MVRSPEPARASRTMRPHLPPRALLHIGAAGRHAELPAADIGQHGDALADLLMRGAGKAQPEATARMGLVDRPFRARIDGDASGKRRLVRSEERRVGKEW